MPRCRISLAISDATAGQYFDVALIKPSCDQIHYPTPPRWAGETGPSAERRRQHTPAGGGRRPTFAPCAVANENRYDTNSIPISDTDVARVNVIVVVQICNSLSVINNACGTGVLIRTGWPFHAAALPVRRLVLIPPDFETTSFGAADTRLLGRDRFFFGRY